MKNAWLCWEADADVLDYWAGGCLDLASGAGCCRVVRAAVGGGCFLQDVVGSSAVFKAPFPVIP